MVSTRSQDNTPAKVGKASANDDGIAVVIPGKRNKRHDEDASTPNQPAAKRRRAVEKLKSDVASTPKTEKAITVEIEEQNGDDRQHQGEPEPIIRPQMVIEAVVQASRTSQQPSSRTTPKPAERNLLEPMPTNLRRDSDREEALPREDDEQGDMPSVTTPSKKSGKSKRAKNTTPHEIKKSKPSTSPEKEADKSVTAPILPAKSHKRFTSTSPEPSYPPPQDEHKNEEPPPMAPSDNTTDSSDDEAPETVTASAGQTLALTAALEASKAAAQHDAERKSKRRERDARLKEQAKAAKKDTKAPKVSQVKTLIEGEAVDQDKAPTSEQPPQATHKKNHSLPTLLPDHILADEPTIGPPIPIPTPTNKASTPTKPKKKLLNLEQKPPKDVRNGRLKIRVLQEISDMLPPKASQQGRALREAWLMGRRGGSGVERRKMIGMGGFVRQ